MKNKFAGFLTTIDFCICFTKWFMLLTNATVIVLVMIQFSTHLAMMMSVYNFDWYNEKRRKSCPYDPHLPCTLWHFKFYNVIYLFITSESLLLNINHWYHLQLGFRSYSSLLFPLTNSKRKSLVRHSIEQFAQNAAWRDPLVVFNDIYLQFVRWDKN